MRNVASPPQAAVEIIANAAHHYLPCDRKKYLQF
jgi:hypothetical protein